MAGVLNELVPPLKRCGTVTKVPGGLAGSTVSTALGLDSTLRALLTMTEYVPVAGRLIAGIACCKMQAINGCERISERAALQAALGVGDRLRLFGHRREGPRDRKSGVKGKNVE